MLNNYFGVLPLIIVFRITNSEYDCKPSARGEDYRGTLSQTNTGKTCQHWNIHVPHAHTLGPLLPGGATANVNYCRNPDSWNHPQGPWCYTLWANVTWEYCNISLCSNPQPVASWIFDVEHDGSDTSFLKENAVTMANLTYGPGLNGEQNGAVILPGKPSEQMIVRNPTSALRFTNELSFITMLYVVGNTGPIVEYNQWNGKDPVRLGFYIYPDSTTLLTSLYSYFDRAHTKPHEALNVLNQGWHKIGISITASEVRTYLNGNLIFISPSDNREQTLNRYTSDGDLYFGAFPNRYNRTVGRMACAKFYDVALNDVQMNTIGCKNIACSEILNGRCVGNCIGYNAGQFCDIYLNPLSIQKTSISTTVSNTKAIEVSWKISKVPEPEARKFYQFSVRYTPKGLFDFKHSPAIKIGDDFTDSYVYTYTIDNLQRDKEYEISVRSERAVADSKDYVDSGIVIAKVPCVAPESPKGLYITKQNDTFLITWTSNLEKLDGGCSTMQTYIYFKFKLSDYWNIYRVFSQNYTFSAEEHDDCFVKMVVINNADMETSTAVYTLSNVTLPLPTSSNGGPANEASSTTPHTTVIVSTTDQQTQEGLTQTTLVLAMCLAFVSIILFGVVVVTVVCWNKYKKDLKSKNNQIESQGNQLENLKVNLATYKAGNRKIEDAPYLEPVSSSDDMYHEIDSKNLPGAGKVRQYESLDTTIKD